MKKSYLYIASFALLGLVGLAALPVYADTANEAIAGGMKRAGHFFNKGNLTDEQKAELEKKMEERRAEAEARQVKIDSAIAAGDYDAFVAAAGEDCPMLEKVTKDNFPKFAEAHNLMKQAREKLAEIGIEEGGFGGFMSGGAMGMKHGFGIGGQGMMNR
ncbi:MAG: hypothetical protein WC745_01425 [Patescibacteria group bacterium]|jgi:Spy/CpxP family protein refolding chaperone